MNAMIEMLEGREMFSVTVAGSEATPVTTDQPVVVVDGSDAKVHLSDFHCTKKMDAASPKLM
jgi:hypothetical protein